VILTRVYPRADDPIDLTSGDARDRLADLYRPPGRDWLRLNLVGSVSGSATGSDGTSETLTNPADRALLGVIRSLADVVLVGAASVRAEGYFVPRKAALAIVTSTGDLSGHRITSTGQRGPLLILCPEAAAAVVRRTVDDPAARVIPVRDADGRLAAHDIVAALRLDGYRSIVAEGGPILAAHLLAGGAVDELCLTTSPVLNGASVPLFGSSEFAGRPLELSQLLVDDASGVYARWAVSADAEG
jgi:riboflavin biosynthesis pyrimidine reductase